jgi:hypothetical protein
MTSRHEEQKERRALVGSDSAQPFTNSQASAINPWAGALRLRVMSLASQRPAIPDCRKIRPGLMILSRLKVH